MGKSAGQRQAQEAGRISTELQGRYAAAGEPALRGAIGHATQLSKMGLPAYVDRAYAGAETGALESRALSSTQALSQIAPPELLGGTSLRTTSDVQADAGANYLDQLSKIRTSRGIAQIQQKNNITNILSGGGTAGTNLAAGFGSQNIGAISQMQDGPGFGLAMAGLSAGSSLLLNSFGNKPANLPGYSNTLANVLGNHPGVGP